MKHSSVILYVLSCIMFVAASIFVACIFSACDIQTQDIDIENGRWVFMGESKLIKATSVFDGNGYWEHWHLEFENGIVLNTKEWETKPYWEGKTYGIYYNQGSRKIFLEMK